MIKAILFDVGGTLIRPHPSVGHVYGKIAASFGIETPAEALNHRFNEIWKRKKSLREEINREWWKSLVAEVFAPYAASATDPMFDAIYEAFKDPRHWKIFSDVKDTLTQAKRFGFRLAVASNWDERLSNLLDRLKLGSFFEKKFISHQIGFVKPDVRFFEHALKEMNVAAEEALHIGDDAIEDLEGAKKAGLHALLLDRQAGISGPEKLSRLSDLFSTLAL